MAARDAGPASRTLETDVLICGAGPTGLVLALWLARAGVPFRIIDQAPEPGTSSRALVVHARTLEFYRLLGFADAFLAEGLKFAAVNMWVRGRHVARATFEEPGRGTSFFPFMIVVPQDRHERFLIDRLGELGVEVERGTALVDFVERDERIVASLRGADGVERTCAAAWLAGCDGAHSRTREILGTDFPGGTYSHVFYVADVDARGPVMNDELHVALDHSDFLGIFPLRGGTTGRLIGTVAAGNGRASGNATLRWDDVGKQIVTRLGIDVVRVNWFSTYRVHHRVSGHFRKGRAFLLGDAAHIHSPVGGQGMNTGIGDAVNLAWKLADVIRRGAPPALLASYEPERIAFARRLVGTTDQAFRIATSPGSIARFVRTRVVPALLPRLFHLPGLQRFMFRTLSQTSLHYRESPICAGRVGAVHGGDRLPWVRTDGARSDNFAVLGTREWQVHLYGEGAADLAAECRRLGVALETFPWHAGMSEAGLTRNALYLVRPDGHVARVAPRATPQAVRETVRQASLLPQPNSSASPRSRSPQ